MFPILKGDVVGLCLLSVVVVVGLEELGRFSSKTGYSDLRDRRKFVQ